MMEKWRIKQQLIIGFIIIIAGSILLSIATIGAFLYWLQKSGEQFIHAANYYEKKIPMIQEYAIQKGERLLDKEEQKDLEKLIPREGITYQVIDSKGERQYGTYTRQVISKNNPLAKNLNMNLHVEDIDKNTTYYTPLLSDDGELKGALGLNYTLDVSYANGWVALLVAVVFGSPFVYVSLLSYIVSHRIGKRLSRPLRELVDASKRIEVRDLDFHIEYKGKNEIGELVTSFENMRAALADSLTRQWELEEERREYVRAISHDLKTPLTIVQGHTEGLQSGLWKNEELLQRYLQTIERNTNRMAKLLGEFDTVNELESFSFQLFVSEVHVESFFHKKIEEYEYVARKKEIEWDVMFEQVEDIKTLVFDRERMSQVMDNIVMNAVRFTPEEGKMLLKVYIQHDELQFHVYDSGPGFQSGDVKKVFQRFYQEDQSRSSSKKHSGLGLYIAKKIVEKHGGNIFAENSAVCGGAHVWFRIPRDMNKKRL
ncbi:HAMP domain-containing sensor histidine kinase [Bacillus sp. XF8]|uniref:sensor histidine kinase n=1 Tax=Bacillus sp. XF8 TaxID=2819289 RepID=UPI001AA064A9|nr:HAMP domain-containing sensor histidine kinase [Bacillus sp. XF8]MBO1580349.1 HAMP domain-containing histidine kinase [Bacillus sp. XF8]